MEGFTFASALDLNIGYYHIKLENYTDAQKYVELYSHEENTNTNAYPWVSKFPQIFQNVMSKLVQDMEYVKTTILS
jgi:ABC-type lipoprotein release transport system permease subunit